jgi:hypothetical protein
MDREIGETWTEEGRREEEKGMRLGKRLFMK